MLNGRLEVKSIIKITNGVPRNPAWRLAEPVNLEILQGEQIAICGDNAAGKTRLVEIITGHYPLLMNQVVYDFQELGISGSGDFGNDNTTPTAKRLISEQLRYITFRDSYGEQDGTYYYQQRWNQHDISDDTPTVGVLLDMFPEHTLGLRERLYKMFKLEPVLDKYIITLSSGELRKFQLMRVLLTQPKVLILDNPFIGLDVEMRDLLSDLLKEIVCQTHLTIIMVLSKYDDVPEFITHVIPMEGMRILQKISRCDFMKKVLGFKGLMVQGVKGLRVQLPVHSTPFTRVSVPSEGNGMGVTGDGAFYPQNGGEILRFNKVSIRYGSRTILKDLDWTVNEGERWALTGENGAGKSTLLSLVCAENPQSYACDIHLFGHKRGSGESIWQIKKHIGYVSPEMHRAYLKDMPAIDIVASGLSDSVGLYVRPKPEQRLVCLDWMKVFGIENIQDRTFLKLSSGEQRLCLLARAFVKDPELLILDEPLHGLDLKNRAMVREIISAFVLRPHKTLVMVSHYEDEFPDCMTHRLFLKRNV